ncbi:hypothetical protein AVEN_160903-1 [Araneus ventricosus]|uniref:Uncharacterized protein n=1 Tax=Araneus ventricosus TaxID=182803 RepID=A0A4Y2WRL4_ARAVE|nr:hypothetical protein AVEN_160903-1 [Araneus ventricosus]
MVQKVGSLESLYPRPAKCVPLTAADFRGWLACCREHDNWTPTRQWACVLFSYEYKISFYSHLTSYGEHQGSVKTAKFSLTVDLDCYFEVAIIGFSNRSQYPTRNMVG